MNTKKKMGEMENRDTQAGDEVGDSGPVPVEEKWIRLGIAP